MSKQSDFKTFALILMHYARSLVIENIKDFISSASTRMLYKVREMSKIKKKIEKSQ